MPIRVLDTDQGGQEVLGLVKQLDWLANYLELWSRLAKLDGESLSAFVKDFEGNPAMLATFDGNPKLVESWMIIKKANLSTLRKNPNALKYVDDLKNKAILGSSTTTDYRKNFTDNFPELKNEEFIVHHAIERQVLDTRYPNLISQSEMHSLENLRGIPKNINSDIHLRKIRKIWNDFYNEFPPGVTPSIQQLLDKAKEIDDLFGNLFIPPIR